MVSALGTDVGQDAALIPYTTKGVVEVGQAAMLLVYAPNETLSVRDGEVDALVVYRTDTRNVPRDSNAYMMVVWTSGLPQEARSRAWSFTLDGHPFYVLDLGEQGTFLYDSDTQQWCQWQTDGYVGWNIRNGTRWGVPERIVGGDTSSGYVWELDPAVTIDEGFRDIHHVATGGLMMRERVYKAVEALRIAGSIGALTTAGATTTITLEISDDGGETYPFSATITLTQGNYSDTIEWRSLGSMSAPGRVFRVSDVGGMLRIDGADVYINDWDDEAMQNGGNGP